MLDFSMESVEVISLNCQGLRSIDNRDTLFSWLNCCKADFLCLQEMHAVSEEEMSSWLKSAKDNGILRQGYDCISSPGTNRSSGVAILYLSKYDLSSCARDDSGRMVSARFSSGIIEFQLCNIYGPNKAKEGDAFFENLYAILPPDLPVILCGDFNTVLDPNKDRRGCNPFSIWAYNWSQTLSNLMSSYDLHDAWRTKYPEAVEFTWQRPNNSQASRLDMFWVSTFFLQLILTVGILPFFRSDHSYIHMKFSVPTTANRGPGIWKFNTSLLKDLNFILMVTQFWESWQKEKNSFFSLSAWWDAGKARLRSKIRTYSRKKASTFRKHIRMLENTLFFLKRRAEKGEEVNGLIADTKAELEEAHRQKARGARIRAKVQWAEEGEISSAYFFRLEKKRGEQRLFTAIKDVSGRVVRSLAAIAAAWVTFYTTLFTAIILDSKEQDFFLNQIVAKLTSIQAQSCEGELSLEECKKALDGMAPSKSPGIDGFPAEFYQCFWPLIGHDYVQVMNGCYQAGMLSASQRQGVITLLYKRGDRLEMKNWRPITLLCVDYKIAAKAIANRLLQVLDTLVHTDQTCGIPGRSPVVNNRLLCDIVQDVNKRKVGGAILSLDQEKAFDRVEWSYLQRVLESMQFGVSFRGWIQLFYNNICSCVLVNGTPSNFFLVSRGVRQGCPLSPLLYVLMAETLACAIRAHPSIDGIPLPRTRRAKICQYADDTSIIVMSDTALTAVFSVFGRYEKASGAKLNVAKSHGLLMGTWIDRTNLPVALDWSSTSITIMGSTISNQSEEKDWEARVCKLTELLASWQNRQLSFHGRALVVNMLGLSKFWYHASFLCLPDQVATDIEKLVFPYVWRKKREGIVRSSVKQRFGQGGLGLIDVRRKAASLHAMWIRRLTADRLTRFGMSVDPLCHCGQVETLIHLFVDCPVAKHMLRWYVSLKAPKPTGQSEGTIVKPPTAEFSKIRFW